MENKYGLCILRFLTNASFGENMSIVPTPCIFGQLGIGHSVTQSATNHQLSLLSCKNWATIYFEAIWAKQLYLKKLLVDSHVGLGHIPNKHNILKISQFFDQRLS
jgi:hypothetical protein